MQSNRSSASFRNFVWCFPKRFSVRSLMIITGLVALAIGLYTRQLPTGTLSQWQSNQINVGMSMKEVSNVAGFPIRMTMNDNSGSRRNWFYQIATADSKRQMLTVTFTAYEEKVSSVTRSPLFLGDLQEIVLPLAKYPSHSR